MIIECTACHARFRLDEGKIKGKGARVRCRRCGESILVLKNPETAQASPEESAGNSLDLRSIVGETLGVRRSFGQPTPAVEAPPESTADNAVQPPAPVDAVPPESITETVTQAPQGEREEAPPAEQAPSEQEPTAAPMAVEAAPETRDEIDTAFEEFLRSTSAPDAPPPETEAASPEVEKDLTVEFRPEEKMELPAFEPGAPIPDLPSKETEPPEPPEVGFLMTGNETLGFLTEEAKKETRRDEFDISTSLRKEPEVPRDSAGTPEIPIAADFLTREHEPSPREPSPPESREDIQPAPLRPKETPVALAPAKPKPPETWKAPPPLVRPSLLALILLFLCLAGGGAYLGFTESGQETLKSMIPRMESLWLQGRGKPGPQYDVRNLIGYYDSGTKAGNLFVIKGQVINVGRTRKSGTRVRAALLDANDNTIVEKSCYAGNMIAGDVLRTANREKIEAELSNRFGNGLVNMDVPPGKSIPFMVVFFDAPNGISAYRLEAREGE